MGVSERDDPDATEAEAKEPLARAGEQIVPEIHKKAFHCPRCGVLARQKWEQLHTWTDGISSTQYWWALCENCEEASVWNEATSHMIEPVVEGGPRPHADMPEDVRQTFDEARAVVNLSPRGACALLRLSVQQLSVHLGQDGKNINEDIAALVENGLPVEVQRALDTVRVVGNNAVHPGEMDLTDDTQTASRLFGLINFIVEDRITRPKEIAELYNQLPQGARDSIEKRDT